MSKNWAMMTNDHKKKLKDAYNTGLADSNPAIIELSTTGMAWYLSLKTAKELTTLSSAFIKNCDILANRYMTHSLTHLLTYLLTYLLTHPAKEIEKR